MHGNARQPDSCPPKAATGNAEVEMSNIGSSLLRCTMRESRVGDASNLKIH